MEEADVVVPAAAEEPRACGLGGARRVGWWWPVHPRVEPRRGGARVDEAGVPLVVLQVIVDDVDDGVANVTRRAEVTPVVDPEQPSSQGPQPLVHAAAFFPM